ncbi:PepSY-associated TM helix domain-containing protein [Mariniflexile sp. AS56]|uniref:PepSY-associated TM helix domain-containing protein n=1 Tax=Mariniflexile sp. AS56 TaxID=3063957 RepID=UPI0026F372C6|nr:PepSY-associated TM helix domain-containing protein [Mariniflexile sp. AS56]MDO7170645.1 PepSY-associated TM helix domain-containing protein [Mariniflexile sp. AS56]
MKKTTFSIRKFINDIHLWLGLASGIIIFLVCFSGTILAFEHEIKTYFTEEVIVEATSNKLPLENLVNTLKQSNNGFVTGVTIPVEANEPYLFSVKKDLKERRGTQILVNPYTSSIHKIEKTKTDTFLFTMFKLHRWLLLETTIGRPIVGVATIIFLLLAVSGIVLWFPKKLKWKHIKHGLKIKTGANWKRINHDLHNTLGFYACIIIVIMGVTGLCWSFQSYREGLSTILNAKIFERTTPEFNLDAKNKPVSLDEALKIANTTLNYKGELAVTFPNKKNNYYTFRKSNEENWSPVTTDNLYMDSSGSILAIEWFKDKPLNIKIAALIRPIHTGEIFGTLSKIIYFIACLIATSLPVTGTIIWLNKLKKKRKKTITTS